MQTLVVNQREVRELLPMDECIDVIEGALRALSRGEGVVQPLRTAAWLPDRRGLIGLMPAYLGSIDAPGVKVVTVYPGNHGTERDSHQGAVLLFEGTHGSLIAVMDGSEITAIRTAAASGVATRLLARDDATRLAIIGSGVQARTHLDAMLAVRPISAVRVWSRNRESARAFVDRASRTGVAVEVAQSASAACDGADIVCTTTSSTEPVLEADFLAPGAHINAVGACVKAARELDTATVVRSRLYVDCRESAVNESGDFLIPKGEGAIGDDHIVGELGDVLLGRVAGRRSADEVTLFKSLGVGVEDVAAAHHIYNKARELGIGTALELGGARDVE